MEPDEDFDLTDLEAMVLALLDQGPLVVDADPEDHTGEIS